MDNIDLGTTRLADKLQGAVAENIDEIARRALQSYENDYALKPVATTPQQSAPYKSSCQVCSWFNGKIGILVLAALAFFVLFRA